VRLKLAGMTLAAALALPGAAFADVRFQAVDNLNVWTPDSQTVKVGETVTWSFAGTTLMHNVKADTGPWATPFESAYAIAGPDATYTFTAPGVYTFFCFLHQSTMKGTVTVTDATGAPPPPPPPPPLSEQPWVNDVSAPGTLEVRDTVAPKLDKVSVKRARKAAKVRLRLSEPAKVTIRLTRGKSVKRRTVELAKGVSTVKVSGLRAGTYTVRVSATDLAGNAARAPKRARIPIRSSRGLTPLGWRGPAMAGCAGPCSLYGVVVVRANRSVLAYWPEIRTTVRGVAALLTVEPVSMALRFVSRQSDETQANNERRKARPSTAIASWDASSGRHTEAAVAIVSFSAVKDSITIGPA
jgi:plastocyanin